MDIRRWKLILKFADESLEIDSEAMVKIPEFTKDHSLRLDQRPSRHLDGRMEIELSRFHDSISELEAAIIARTDPVAALLLAQTPPFQTPETPVWQGYLQVLRKTGSTVILEFRFHFPNPDQPICRNSASLAGYESLPPVWLPRLYGEESYQAPALFQYHRERLDQDFSTGATMLVLRRAVDWPFSGTLQIGDEKLRYTNFFAPDHILQFLTRTEPKSHNEGAEVYLIPDRPEWCIADHPALPLELRADNEAGAALPLDAVEPKFVSGVSMTLFRPDRLPLAPRYSAASRPVESERRADHWQDSGDSTAPFWVNAFLHLPPSTGARMADGATVIEADYIGDLASGPFRFDRIRSAALELEFADTGDWGPDTRLIVTVTKAGESAHVSIDRNGVQNLLTAEGKAELPDTGGGQGASFSRRLSFQSISESGGWSNAVYALNELTDHAAIISSGGPASLSARFTLPAEIIEETCQSADFAVVIQNNGANVLSVQLTASIPGVPLSPMIAAINPGDEQVLRLPIPLPPGGQYSDLLASPADYTLSLPSGGDAEVRAMWLEAYLQSPEPDWQWPKSVTDLDVQVSFSTPYVYTAATVELTGLAAPYPVMDFFALSDPVQVRIEVENPPTPEWRTFVRACRFVMETNPAEELRLVKNIWVRARGIGDTPSVNPVTALRDLLTDPRLGAVPEFALDSVSFNAAESELDARGVTFRRLFQGGDSLGALAGRAMAESALALDCGATWRVTALPLALSETTAELVPASDIVNGQFTATQDRLAVITAGGAALSWRGELLASTGAEPRAYYQTAWLHAGASLMIDSWRAYAEPFTRALQMSVRPERLADTTGSIYTFETPLEAGAVSGELTAVEWRAPDLRWTFSRLE